MCVREKERERGGGGGGEYERRGETRRGIFESLGKAINESKAL